MIISSEITGKEYNSVELCLADEKKFLEEKAKKEKAAKEHEQALDAAYKKAIDACDEYLRLCGIDVEFTDHGYKVKYHGNGGKADAIFEDILNMMLK